ncbi:DsrE family protein [Glaciecola sp. SC05]|uniref:DsrE family protein n=1 Tax=Glaciecola sp. SC05 TaxID=1987355 RepID=UPI0035281815
MRRIIFISLLLFSVQAAAVDLPNFASGPLINEYGKHTAAPSTSVGESSKFKIAFDVAKGAEAGEVNRQFDSLARFINMHVAAGVPKENIELALIVHGRASMDLLDNVTYQKVHSKDNPNIELLNILMKNQVQVLLCGQTAGAYEIRPEQLVEGVIVELSAMTAHALLQQQGYTVNPF